MNPLGLEEISGLFTGLLVYGAMSIAALWLAMILWAYRDMRARSRDTLAHLVVALMVAVLTLPGLFIYLFLRPRETLAEAYERSLEEEALLQDIEERPMCPGCKQRVQDDWQVCPHCHTRLKKPCSHCGRMLELAWDLCPYCATTSSAYVTERPAVLSNQEWHTAAADPWTASQRDGRRKAARRTEQLEFIEGDEP
ncbi:MAG: zinc ribbon domain-containing protein [Aggregatilineales bacterium]